MALYRLFLLSFFCLSTNILYAEIAKQKNDTQTTQKLSEDIKDKKTEKSVKIIESHAISLFGDFRYPKNFKHFAYANIAAPKGGIVTLSAIGGFDTLNALNGRGEPAPMTSLLYDTLLSASLDEPASEYGLIAKLVRYPENFSWVEFDLRDNAKFHDGKPITADDVVFSMNILKTKGDPLYRFYYANVKKVTALSKHKVRFEFDKKGNRELPLIVGQFPIFPKHYWQGKDFAHTTLKPLLGSGPYKIKSVKPNKSIVFERVKNYWAKDLPVNKGNYNFDEIRVEMYRETTVAFEAFKAGEYDYFTDISAKNWTQNYNFAAVNNGFIKKEIFKRLHPQPMQGLVFNLRKEKFKDRKVREALNYLMDFDWMNQNLFYNSYKRTRSYFQSSELEAKGLPSKEELAILEPYKNKLPQEVFTQEYNPPSIDPQKGFRMNMRQAQKLLMDAGYTVKGGKLYDKKGKPFDIEILITESSFERALSPMVETMQKIGIHVNLRLIDQAQYVRRLQNFDYDMIVAAFAQSSSPGNEQREFWGSTSANRSSSRNYIGIQDPIIDSLIERIVFAKHRDDLIVATKALDRVLQWGFYLIPQWYADGDRIAYWNKFGKPEMANSYANGFPNLWWYDKEKADLINLPKK